MVITKSYLENIKQQSEEYQKNNPCISLMEGEYENDVVMNALLKHHAKKTCGKNDISDKEIIKTYTSEDAVSDIDSVLGKTAQPHH